jgi:chemotaxis protein MotB
MGKLIATSGATLLLLASGSPVLSGTAAETQFSTPVTASGTAGGGHENVETLKAELEALQTKLTNTETGRQFLKTRLEEVLGESKTKSESISSLEMENKDLLKSLRFMTDNRDYLVDEMAMKGEEQEKASAMMEADHAKQSVELDRARKGRTFLRERYQKSRENLVEARNESAELQAALDKTRKGRKFLSTQYLKNLSELKQLKADNADSAEQTTNLQAENERLTVALERALSGRNFLSGRVSDMRAELKEKDNEMDELAAVSFAQINSAIGERDAAREMASSTEWADGLSAKLTESFGAQSGTEVTALSNNSVAIKVGNTGLFRLGSTNLSSNGEVLLNEIGQALVSQDDAQIMVVGHTDNIPTGTGSRFANNTELSLARATSALSYLTSVGVPAERISAAGYGESYPIASNDTEDGQLANRRVEIVLTPMQ